ncbi:MAG: class I adenylate-forming enzyme family protein [Acidimicrobiales bacterium]
MNRLVPLEATGSRFVDELQRAWADGDAVLPVDPRLPAPNRAALLAAAELDRPVGSDDALVMATSGTSGEPKLAVLTHEAVAASAVATSARLAVDPSSDRWLACLPLAHVGGLSVVTRALHTGTPLIVHDAFDAAEVERAAGEGCTLTALVPTALSRIDPSRFRAVLLGGQAPPRDRPPHVVATYGLTETGSGVVYDGVPLAGVEVRVDAQDEVHLRGPMLLRTYRDGHDPKDSGGWLPTGDIGRLQDGRLEVSGRRGDLIITGGENVWPAVVERILELHPAVAEVAVVGRPDAEWGQRVVAVVVPTPGAPLTLEDLRTFAKERLPAFAAPKDLELVAGLPRTTSGKVRRGELSQG